MQIKETENYIDLHIHTKYTKNNGITEIEQLVNRAKEYGMKKLAIADSGTISGVKEFYKMCKCKEIEPIIGCGFYFAVDSCFVKSSKKYHIVLLAKSKEGFDNLIDLVRFSYEEGFYLRPRIDFELLEKYKDGLICLSGGLGGLIDKSILAGNKKNAENYVRKFKDIFGFKNFYLELQDNELEKNEIINKELANLAESTNTQLIVSGGSFYLNRNDAEKCNDIRKASGKNELKGSGYYFKSPTEIMLRFVNYQKAIKNTLIVAGKCNYSINEQEFDNPVFNYNI